MDIKGTLERAFGLPVTVANDANCMLLGEVWPVRLRLYRCHRCDAGHRVGGGILTGGRLLEGARGLGGELGHFRLHALDGVACTCGAIGCYERYAATTALVRSARRPGWTRPTGVRSLRQRRGRRPHAGCAQRLDQRDRPGPCGPCTHLQPAADPDRRRRQRAAGASDRPAGRAGAQSIMPAFAEGLEVRAAASRTTPALSVQCTISEITALICICKPKFFPYITRNAGKLYRVLR